MDGNPAEITRALVFAGGDAPSPLPLLGQPDYVVAADGGLAHALAAGYTPDIVVGDLDSADPAELALVEAAGTRIERHPTAKDATDWELALHHVATAGYRKVTIVGGAGGRLDHLIANALVLTNDTFAGLDLTWHVGMAIVVVASSAKPARVSGRRGEYVSLLAAGGQADGVTTTGLRWPLQNATLAPGTSLGVSNELAHSEATVSVAAGTLLVIHEGKTP